METAVANLVGDGTRALVVVSGYFGDRPTFDTGRTFLEVYLIGFEGDLYGARLFVEFIDLIRPDKRFSSIDELVLQMKADCAEALARLDAVKADDPVAGFTLGRLFNFGVSKKF